MGAVFLHPKRVKPSRHGLVNQTLATSLLSSGAFGPAASWIIEEGELENLDGSWQVDFGDSHELELPPQLAFYHDFEV